MLLDSMDNIGIITAPGKEIILTVFEATDVVTGECDGSLSHHDGPEDAMPLTSLT